MLAAASNRRASASDRAGWLATLAGLLARSPGGVVLTWPYKTAPGASRINGKPAQWKDGELRITALPARVVVTSP